MGNGWSDWRELLRDAAIIYALTFLGGFILGISGITVRPENAKLYTAMTIMMTIIGFAIVGCITKRKRKNYLPQIAVLLWLMSLSNVFLGFMPLGGWVFSIVGTMMWMMIGGGISYLFVRCPQPSTQPT